MQAITLAFNSQKCFKYFTWKVKIINFYYSDFWKLLRPRISINWNPPFQTSLHKISEEVFFRLTIFFSGTIFFSKKQLLFSFLCIVRQKKILEWSEKFWKIIFFGNLLSKFGSERGDFNWCRFWASWVCTLMLW